MTKKRIALVMYSLNIGGAEKVLGDLSIEYAKAHEVSLILFDTSLMYYPYAGTLIDLNLPTVNGTIRKAINLLRRAWKLHKVFRQHQFDHIISFMENANFPAIMASREVIAVNHCSPNELPSLEWLFARWLYPKAKKIVAVSKSGAEVYRQRLGLTNITYLHNPISLKRIAEQIQQPAPDMPQRDFIINVARLSPAKNQKCLISAFKESGLYQHYQLLILGEGTEHDALAAQIQHEGLVGHVILMGFIGNPYPYIAKAKCLVLSSIHEGFPVIIIEALACGCPVIATRCETGPDEIIEHGKNGLLVAVDDTPALAQALKQLLLDPDLYQTIKHQTQTSVQHLDITEVAQRWLEL